MILPAAGTLNFDELLMIYWKQVILRNTSPQNQSRDELGQVSARYCVQELGQGSAGFSVWGWEERGKDLGQGSAGLRVWGAKSPGGDGKQRKEGGGVGGRGGRKE